MQHPGWPVDPHIVQTKTHRHPNTTQGRSFHDSEAPFFSFLTGSLSEVFYFSPHMASIVYLISFPFLSGVKTPRKQERKKDGGVSEEAHGSWGSLITVMTARDGGWKTSELERGGQESLAGISLQRSDESAHSAPFALLLIWGSDITSCSSAELLKVSGARGEVNTSQSGRQKHMGSALNYCQSS